MKEYNIGLDIGTTSVGWSAVEKSTSKVMRKGKKSLWGVRLFEEAVPAASRRVARSTRRRFDRRRERISLLQQEFQEEINKVDSKFFDKLQESFYQEHDYENKKNPLSKEEKEKIKEYYKKYPTIYHVRQELINNPDRKDIRFVYLAIHHMIKYRGNFLYETNDLDIDKLDLQGKLREVFSEIANTCPELDFDIDKMEAIDYAKLELMLLEKSKTDRKLYVKDYLKSFFQENPKFSDNFSKLVVGNKFSVMGLFSLELEEGEKDLSISFAGSDFEDKEEDLSKLLKDKFETLTCMKSLYDMLFLKEIFGDRKTASISDLMVDYYLEHQNDLKNLKTLLDLNRKEYRKVFRTNTSTTCLYDEYIHNHITYDDFKNKLLKSLEVITDDAQEKGLTDVFYEVSKKLAEGNFLPRITSTANGKYPYQLNKSELKKIIENQGKYYPFLLEKINGEYKLILLLSFRIPYYVGPLFNDHDENHFAWIIRKQENVKITPYNFEEVVDKDASAEQFIVRMLRSCTYLLKEKAMPSNSLLYSEYKVLNELKQIKVNGEKLTSEMQHKIMDEFFRKESGTLTDAKFKRFLVTTHDFDMYKGDLTITGYSADGKFANNLNSYIDFYGPDGFFKDTNLKQQDAEEIIRWMTIFEDKEILAQRIEKSYPILKPVISHIVKKRYTGWSNLSEKLLTGIFYDDPETSLKKSIMDLMWETEENFMQIINNEKYGFQEKIAKENGVQEESKLNYQMVEELATSPATKRGIWQALQVVEELVEYIGYEPSSISIEMARGDEKKERKDDRKKYLSKLYSANKESIEQFKRLSAELNDIDEKEMNEKIFLYFIQEGKSLYSGVPLDIHNLEQYEVDHILPRTLIKNDSIENKALVLKEENQEKAASLVLPSRFQRNRTWWEHLKDIKLISATKFYHLTRKEYKEEDIEGFINRQLVETRQITKHVANILQALHKDSKIIYLPASLSHNYRDKFHLYKFRDLNDYHHAHDAYLAAVLGEYKNYCNLQVNFEDLKELTARLRQENKYRDLKYGYIINSIDSAFQHVNHKTGEVLDIEKFKNTVENHLYRNDILISKKTEIRTGEFYNQTKLKKGDKGVPLKKNMKRELYGAYSSLNPSYAIMVEFTKRNKTERKLVGMPIYLTATKNQETIDAYFKNLLGLKEQDSYHLVGKPIPFYAELNWEKCICSLVGASDKVEVCNAKEFQLTKAEMLEYKEMLNRLWNGRKKDIDDIVYSQKLTNFISLIIQKVEQQYVLYQNLVPDMKKMFLEPENLEVEQKEKIIIQMLNLLKCNSVSANLKFLNSSYSMAFGKKNGRIIEHAIIINKSVTGLRTREYEF